MLLAITWLTVGYSIAGILGFLLSVVVGVFTVQYTRKNFIYTKEKDNKEEILKLSEDFKKDIKEDITRIETNIDKIEKAVTKLSDTLIEKTDSINKKIDDKFESANGRTEAISEKMDTKFEKVNEKFLEFYQYFDTKIDNIERSDNVIFVDRGKDGTFKTSDVPIEMDVNDLVQKKGPKYRRNK